MRVSDSSFVPVGNSSKIPQKRHSDDDISFKLPKKSKVHNARHGLFHKAGDQASLPAKEFASNRSEDDTMHIDGDLPLRYRSPEASTDQTTSPPTAFSRESSATAHTSETTNQQTTPASRPQQAVRIQDSCSVEFMSLDDNCDCNVPAPDNTAQTVTAFNFFAERLSDELRIKIMRYVCELEESEKPRKLGERFTYKPSYRAGMRLEMLTDGDDPDSGDTPARDQRYQRRDNVNWPRAIVSRRFAKIYWEAWYNVNSFEFDDPRAAKWWFKNIGDQKLSYVKELQLSVTSGFSRERLRSGQPNVLLDESAEALWYQVLSWLQYRHNLDYFTITFLRWPDPAAFTRSSSIGGISEENVEDLTMARAKLFGKLWALRGIAHPKVIDRYGHAFADDKDQIPEIELGLTQKRNSGRLPKGSFAEVLESTQEQFRLDDMISRREVYGTEGSQVEEDSGLLVLDGDQHNHSNWQSADYTHVGYGGEQTENTPSGDGSGKAKRNGYYGSKRLSWNKLNGGGLFY